MTTTSWRDLYDALPPEEHRRITSWGDMYPNYDELPPEEQRRILDHVHARAQAGAENIQTFFYAQNPGLKRKHLEQKRLAAEEAKAEKIASVFGWALRAISFGIIVVWKGWAFGLTAIGISLIIEDLYRRMGRS